MVKLLRLQWSSCRSGFHVNRDNIGRRRRTVPLLLFGNDLVQLRESYAYTDNISGHDDPKKHGGRMLTRKIILKTDLSGQRSDQIALFNRHPRVGGHGFSKELVPRDALDGRAGRQPEPQTERSVVAR